MRDSGERSDAGAAPFNGPSIEERLRRLDEIASTLEGDGIDLERGMELFEEGVRHLREIERVLSEAELRVEELLGEGETLRTRPLGEGP